MTESQPLVSIDVVPLRFNRSTAKIEFATGVRIFEPWLGEDALPGVLLHAGESIPDAAERALQVKTGLPAPLLRQLGAFDSTNRDPRGATISITLLAAQTPDVESELATWHSDIFTMPFDHEIIVGEALERTSQMLWRDEEFTRTLLGETFTTADAVAIGSPTPHASNVRRWLEAWGPVERINEVNKTGAVGRPAVAWRWIND